VNGPLRTAEYDRERRSARKHYVRASRRRIAEFALHTRLPTISLFTQFPGSGLSLENWRFWPYVWRMATVVRCNCGAEYERTEAKFLMPHTGRASCEVCGAVLESWLESTHVAAFELIKRPDEKLTHIRGMAPEPPPLTHEEFVSLRNCAKGLMHRAIPVEHKDRLIQLGYIQELSGGLRLTNAGRLRIVEGE
jgi:hypothetical protein